jgi:outer membrane protein W
MKSIRPILPVFLCTGLAATAQDAPPAAGDPRWSFRARIVLSGSSDRSEPEGYLVYSAISVEPAVVYSPCRRIAFELSVRTESHEVDFMDSEIGALGSIELLPVNLLAVYCIGPGKKCMPYAGAGVNATFCWEKSGALNSTDLPPGFGPAAALGFYLHLSPRTRFNLGIGWNLLRMDIENKGEKFAELQMDPMHFGAGLAFSL